MKHIVKVLGSASCRVNHVIHKTTVNDFTITLKCHKSMTFFIHWSHLKHWQNCNEETLVNLHCKLLHQQLTVSVHTDHVNTIKIIYYWIINAFSNPFLKKTWRFDVRWRLLQKWVLTVLHRVSFHEGKSTFISEENVSRCRSIKFL